MTDRNHAPRSSERALQEYEQLLREKIEQREAWKAQYRRFNSIRVTVFLVGVLLLFGGYGSGSTLAITLGWITVPIFFWAVIRYQIIEDALAENRHRRMVLRRLRARLQRRFDRLSEWTPVEDDDSPFDRDAMDVAADLDLFGKGSLFQLVSMAMTGPGRRTLASWICGPATKRDGSARAAAARSLSDKREQRLRFYELARRVSDGTSPPDRFVDWAVGDRFLEGNGATLHTWAKLSVLLGGGGGVLLALAIASHFLIGSP
ncbi:MAG: hypothetical protein AAFP90_00095, partial [Planctomycetota bacterium]